MSKHSIHIWVNVVEKKGKMLLLYIFHIRIFLNTCVFKRKYRLNAEQAAYLKSITTVDPTLIWVKIAAIYEVQSYVSPKNELT